MELGTPASLSGHCCAVAVEEVVVVGRRTGQRWSGAVVDGSAGSLWARLEELMEMDDEELTRWRGSLCCTVSRSKEHGLVVDKR